jgi:zinc transport system substrate-binding protein
MQIACKIEMPRLFPFMLARSRVFTILLWFFSVASVLGAKLEVLTTFAPIHCFTLNVAGNAAHVTVLLPPNAGPHDYSFAPSDIRKISEADLIIANGVNLENWLDKGIKSAGKAGLGVVDTSKGINLITDLQMQKLAGVKAEKDPDAGGPNPHIWLSPLNAIVQVGNIRDAMAAKDPAKAEVYRANAAVYIDRLKKLDALIRSRISDFPEKNLITFHDTFPYFARDYGFTVAATFEEFPGKSPTPRAIEQLREIIAKGKVKALFSEPQFSPKALQILGQEFKIAVVQLDPMETGDGEADFYERVTQKNLDALVAAFHGAN